MKYIAVVLMDNCAGERIVRECLEVSGRNPAAFKRAWEQVHEEVVVEEPMQVCEIEPHIERMSELGFTSHRLDPTNWTDVEYV